MRAFTAGDAARMCGAEVLGSAGALFSGVTYDSRTACGGRLFVAVKGGKSDGNDFVGAAFEEGASAAISSRAIQPPEGKALLLHDSPETAVRRLAAEARKEFKGTVIGIVGSAGKTTTKDFSARFLSLLGPTFATGGNRNNLLGLPEMILGADYSAKFWVLEMGISTPGEMDMLAPIAAPDAVLFTSIRPVHMEFFHSMREILEEKSKVLNHSAPSSFYIYNADDELLSELPMAFRGRRFSYGASEGANVRIMSVEEKGEKGFSVTLSREKEEVTVALPFLNKVQVHNFAAAAALATIFGAPLSLAAEVAPRLSPAGHRGVPHYLRDGILLYDDSYNSNPEALAALIESAARWKRRLVGVLGEMKELGPHGEEYHREAGALAARHFASLLCVGGEGARTLSLSFSASGNPCFYAERWEDGYRWLTGQVDPSDAVIVKGSRSIGLDGLAERFIAEYREGGAK